MCTNNHIFKRFLYLLHLQKVTHLMCTCSFLEELRYSMYIISVCKQQRIWQDCAGCCSKLRSVQTSHKLTQIMFVKQYIFAILFQTPVLCIRMQAPRLECVTENYFLISQPKHMLWALKRTVSMRHMFKPMA